MHTTEPISLFPFDMHIYAHLNLIDTRRQSSCFTSGIYIYWVDSYSESMTMIPASQVLFRVFVFGTFDGESEMMHIILLQTP